MADTTTYVDFQINETAQRSHAIDSASASRLSHYDSDHPSGVNVLIADGHVQILKKCIKQTTWWILRTIAGGDVMWRRLLTPVEWRSGKSALFPIGS